MSKLNTLRMHTTKKKKEEKKGLLQRTTTRSHNTQTTTKNSTRTKKVILQSLPSKRKQFISIVVAQSTPCLNLHLVKSASNLVNSASCTHFSFHYSYVDSLNQLRFMKISVLTDGQTLLCIG
jgi:hypothetical protein